MKSRLKQRIFALSLLAWTAVCPADAQQTRSLRDQFLSPSDEAKPWTFWYWMYGAVSKEGITADLEAMKRAGLGGTYLMPIKGIHEGAQYDGKAQQLTPEWWEMVRFSMEEADRLGLKLGMHICDGFAMEQIDLKNYPERFALCGLPVVKVAVSFDSERCTIGDWEIINA